MDNRERILDAASRVYSQHGFRGATTRLIAQEAGVNEVTLFRIFGCKSDLFDALVERQMALATVPALPTDPVEPWSELVEWTAASLEQLRTSSALIRKALAEMEERPAAAGNACRGSQRASDDLSAYVERLRGFASGIPPRDQVWTAASMFVGALIGDALCRDIMPTSFPQPAEAAPEMYVRVLLRSIGAPELAPDHPQWSPAATDDPRDR